MSNEQTKITQECEALQTQIKKHSAKAGHHAKMAGDLSKKAEKLLRAYAGLMAHELGVFSGAVYERLDNKSRWRVSHAFPQSAVYGEHVLVHIYMTGLTKAGKPKMTTATPLLQQLVESDKLPPINDALPRFTLIKGGA